MLLQELTARSIGGLSPELRVTLKDGYNVLVPQGTGTRSPLPELLDALLYGATLESGLATGEGAGAGLSLRAPDGSIWHLAMELGGRRALYQLTPGGEWSLASGDEAAIGGWIASSGVVPPRILFRELLCTRESEFPSRAESSAPAPRAAGISGSYPRPPSASGASAQQPPVAAGRPRSLPQSAIVEAALRDARRGKSALSESERAAKLEALKAEIAYGKNLDSLQYRMEGLLRRNFDLEKSLAVIGRFEEAAREAEARCKEGFSFESLGFSSDALERAAHYDNAQRQHEKNLEKLADELSDARYQADRAKPLPAGTRTRLFLFGALGLAALATGILFFGTPIAYLALLAIPAFGYAAWLGIEWVSEWQHYEVLGRKRLVAQDREEKARAAFDAEYFALRSAMRSAGVSKGAEFIGLYQRQQANEAERARAQKVLETALADPSFVKAREELEQNAAQIASLEAELASGGVAAMRDWHEAERELAQLLGDAQDDEEALEPSPGAPTHPEGVAAAGLRISEQAAAVGARQNAIPRLLARASEALGQSRFDTFTGGLIDRAGKYLNALSDGRFSGVDIEGSGRAVALSRQQKLGPAELDRRDYDLLYLSVKLTVQEKLAPRLPFLLFDEPFMGFSESKLQLLSKMLKHIATSTQVLHVTAQRQHLSLADVAAKL